MSDGLLAVLRVLSVNPPQSAILASGIEILSPEVRTTTLWWSKLTTGNSASRLSARPISWSIAEYLNEPEKYSPSSDQSEAEKEAEERGHQRKQGDEDPPNHLIYYR
jgi:hypothetical protein